MSKRLAAITISETSQCGALLPPPPTAAKLEPRSLSGPLHEGSCSAEAAAQTNDMQHADEAAEQQESSQKRAAKGGDAAGSTKEQQPEHAELSSVPDEEQLDEKGEEGDDQFGSFVVA